MIKKFIHGIVKIVKKQYQDHKISDYQDSVSVFFEHLKAYIMKDFIVYLRYYIQPGLKKRQVITVVECSLNILSSIVMASCYFKPWSNMCIY